MYLAPGTTDSRAIPDVLPRSAKVRKAYTSFQDQLHKEKRWVVGDSLLSGTEGLGPLSKCQMDLSLRVKSDAVLGPRLRI